MQKKRVLQLISLSKICKINRLPTIVTSSLIPTCSVGNTGMFVNKNGPRWTKYCLIYFLVDFKLVF